MVNFRILHRHYYRALHNSREKLAGVIEAIKIS